MEKKLIEKYSDNSVLRALVNLIPNIGGAIDILLSEKGAKWREERLFKLLSELDYRIGNLEKGDSLNQKIKEELESEEFYDLLIQSLNSVIRTRHNQKISCYANILINSIIKTKNNQFSSELMIATLDNLTLDEIEYLSELKKASGQIELFVVFGTRIYWDKYLKNIEITGNVADKRDELPNECLFPFDLNLIWKLLSDKNIITIDNIKEFGSLPYTHGSSNYRVSSHVQYTEKIVYKMTEFGNEFIKWIIEN